MTSDPDPTLPTEEQRDALERDGYTIVPDARTTPTGLEMR